MFHKNDLFHTNVGFDMRVPDFGAPPLVVYEEALKMIEYADRNGIDEVHFQEHTSPRTAIARCPSLSAPLQRRGRRTSPLSWVR
jgi:hypothetical protein